MAIFGENDDISYTDADWDLGLNNDQRKFLKFKMVNSYHIGKYVLAITLCIKTKPDQKIVQ